MVQDCLVKLSTDSGLRLDTVTLAICWCEPLESFRHDDAVVYEEPSSGLRSPR